MIGLGLLVMSATSGLERSGVVGDGTTPSGPAGLAPFDQAGGNCSVSSIGLVSVTPQSVSVGGSARETFTATALSNCGTVLTNSTQFSWRLSSSSVGSLGSDSGPSVVYTACLAPMDGVLHVEGAYNGTSRTANATIKIAGAGGGAFPGAPVVTAGNGSESLWSGTDVGLALMGLLIVGGIAVFLWGQRKEPPRAPP